MDDTEHGENEWLEINVEQLAWLQHLLSREEFHIEEEVEEIPFIAPLGWATLPDLVLEKIFMLLNFKERHICSQVCRNWYWIFYSPRLWKHLKVTPRSFTYSRINRYTGEEKEVSKYKVHMCLQQVGRHFKKITILPNPNFHNMSKVLQIIGRFLSEFADVHPLESLQEFDFDFACEGKDLWSHEFVIIGTGGGLLREMNFVLSHLKNMTRLSFNDLCLNSQDAVGFLDEFVINNRDTLTFLEIKNCTRHRYPLLNAAFFPHLTTFITSPLHISDSVVLLLAERTALQKLVLVQDRYIGPCEAVSSHAWSEVKLIAPNLKVRLEVNGRTTQDLVLQPMAPVSEIMFDCPNTQFTAQLLITIAEEYNAHLEVFGNKWIYRQHRSRSFHDRADGPLVLLVRECPQLRTLVVSERISSSTVLIIASEAPKLRNFYVRANAVILKADWLKAMAWSDSHFRWLSENARSYKLVEQEVACILRQPWKMLSDKEFKSLRSKPFRKLGI